MKKLRFNTNKIFWMVVFIMLISVLLLPGCIKTAQPDEPLSGDKVIQINGARNTLRIVSGSENRVLEPIIEDFAKDKKINIVMDYQGSLDIMRLLEQDNIPYDAVWPASSLWISVGDTRHRIKHLTSISITPVIFGIKNSLANDLGFVGRDVKVSEIADAIESGKLKFTMTSATQSNSGASAYIGFLYALLGNPNVMTMEDLDKPELKSEIRTLLSGIERSSGSSDWLKDLFLAGDYDAMVNYEALVISANQILEKENRETLYAVYPVDGLTIADSPLGFISSNGEEDRDEAEKEEAFLELQNYLLQEEVQTEIRKTGRRTGVGTFDETDQSVFRKEWGIDTSRILSTINMPKADVLMKALNAYQSEFKKPGYNIYCLDFSGSMAGDGHQQLIAALEQVMIEKSAAANFLQASDDEVNEFIIFTSYIRNVYKATGPVELEATYQKIVKETPTGGTAIYLAATEALNTLKSIDQTKYSPAIILMTDGRNNGDLQLKDFKRTYESGGAEVPVFSILFGSADEAEMDDIAAFTKARVFDGREDLVNAFKTVRGYN